MVFPYTKPAALPLDCQHHYEKDNHTFGSFICPSNKVIFIFNKRKKHVLRNNAVSGWDGRKMKHEYGAMVEL
jgi:hypothetical protein